MVEPVKRVACLAELTVFQFLRNIPPISRGEKPSSTAMNAAVEPRSIIDHDQHIMCSSPALLPCTSTPSQDDDRLVRAQRPKLCQPRMPHAIVARMSHIWCHTDCQEHWKMTAACFLEDLRLALLRAAKPCPHRAKSCKKSIMVRRFRTKKQCYFQPVPGTARHDYQTFRSKEWRSGRVGGIFLYVIPIAQSWSYAETKQSMVSTRIQNNFCTKAQNIIGVLYVPA